MSAGVDLSEFFETFFDEADELLAAMEQDLLGLDPAEPDADVLNNIFRAAHSIKGGAATFGCFEELARTTHLLENLLDLIRHGEMALRPGMVDLFLRAKDVLAAQVAAYRDEARPDQDAYVRVCDELRRLSDAGAGTAAPLELPVRVRILAVQDKDAEALADEMAIMGDVLHRERMGDELSLWLKTTTAEDDLKAVCCFVVDAEQVIVTREPVPSTPTAPSSAAPSGDERDGPVGPDRSGDAGQHGAGAPRGQPGSSASDAAAGVLAHGDLPAANARDEGSAAIPAAHAASDPSASAPSAAPAAGPRGPAAGRHKESGTIRVGVQKVDQIINLVGELVITQAMLAQTSNSLDPALHERLLNGIEQLDRNARDLQESVMSMRMMPMDYVFSRFPRVVRENARKLGKQVRLVTKGQATELDKSLIEGIIDPLTHLVRNSLDHGFESPQARRAAGKDPEGTLTLSAQHSGGQIIIEVADDGAGLNRDRILAKAVEAGFAVSEATPDDELWPLIFAPGFSTAEKVTDISGRGVGMDVVRRNIQNMGGHIQLNSRPGEGTTIRIALPLTLAILDGMSVKVGEETFILPLSHVLESMQAGTDHIHPISATEQVLHVRGEYLPMVALHEVFQVDGAQTDPTQAITVILQAEDTRFALLVDELVGQHQVVVKNLETNYRKVPGISAATILGDGSVALIVDAFALGRTAGSHAGLAA